MKNIGLNTFSGAFRKLKSKIELHPEPITPMPLENILLTFRRKFGERFRTLLYGIAKPPVIAQAPVSRLCSFEAEYLQEVRHLVETHLADSDFTVDVLCHECKSSQPQLYRKLTALSGLSPVRFIRSVRLRKAKELLRQPSLTIAEVAYETGFTSPAYFTRLFVKAFGMTPSEYRKNGDKSANE